MNIAKVLGVVFLVLAFNPLVRAQSSDRVRQTWGGPDVSPLWELLKDAGAKDVRVDVLTFKPSGDSGVTKALADAIGGTPKKRAASVQAFCAAQARLRSGGCEGREVKQSRGRDDVLH